MKNVNNNQLSFISAIIPFHSFKAQIFHGVILDEKKLEAFLYSVYRELTNKRKIILIFNSLKVKDGKSVQQCSLRQTPKIIF